MTTTSRRLSQRTKHNRNQSTPGKTKGGFCVRPKDFGIATKSNPYKGAGVKGSAANTYARIWNKYKAANNITVRDNAAK